MNDSFVKASPVPPLIHKGEKEKKLDFNSKEISASPLLLSIFASHKRIRKASASKHVICAVYVHFRTRREDLLRFRDCCSSRAFAMCMQSVVECGVWTLNGKTMKSWRTKQVPLFGMKIVHGKNEGAAAPLGDVSCWYLMARKRRRWTAEDF